VIDTGPQERSAVPFFSYSKTHGASAGATGAQPFTAHLRSPRPTSVLEELDGCRAHYQQKERCIYCDIVRQDLSDGNRIVAENPEFLCVTPFARASRSKLWILPKRHAAYFEESQKSQFEFLAPMLSEALRRMDKVLARPSYNSCCTVHPCTEKTGTITTACGDYPEAHASRRLRMGHRLLH